MEGTNESGVKREVVKSVEKRETDEGRSQTRVELRVKIGSGSTKMKKRRVHGCSTDKAQPRSGIKIGIYKH